MKQPPMSLKERLELAAQACRAAGLLSCEATCREASSAVPAAAHTGLSAELSSYLPDLAGKVHLSKELFAKIKAALGGGVALNLTSQSIVEWASGWVSEDNRARFAEALAKELRDMEQRISFLTISLQVVNDKLREATGTESATPTTVKAALVAARGDILQAWADRCGIDVTDERVQEANKVGWPHDYGLFEAGWNALARALISRADSKANG